MLITHGPVYILALGRPYGLGIWCICIYRKTHIYNWYHAPFKNKKNNWQSREKGGQCCRELHQTISPSTNDAPFLECTETDRLIEAVKMLHSSARPISFITVSSPWAWTSAFPRTGRGKGRGVQIIFQLFKRLKPVKERRARTTSVAPFGATLWLSTE